MKPFRWDITKREQLGRLLDIDSETAYPGYLEHIAECASLVVSRSAGKRIIFVGRSPENIFDYLSGIFQETSFEENIDLLNISNRFREIDDIERDIPIAYRALKNHFSELGISPKQIISNPKGLCFSDLVDSGGTFGRLFEFLKKWAQEDRQDLPSIVRKLSFIGITWRTKNSPNTWRWQQNANWIKKYPKITTKNVSVPGQLWHYLGNLQFKVARTNYPERWGSEEIMSPPREERNLKALKQAHQVYSVGLSQKREFAEKLSFTQEFKEGWLRSLTNELKKIA